jgi:hypothetical protein
MPKGRAPGHDNIRNIDLRNRPLNVITHLTKIVNVAIRHHHFPKTWKEADIISIPKPNKNPAFSQNRCPISLMDTTGKEMEKAIYKQIYPELSRHIPDEQFAFLPGRDTTQQLLRLTEHVTETFNKRAYTAAIFSTYPKPMTQSVWNTGLLHKLHTAVTQDSNLLKSYLTARKFRVKLESHFSDWKPIYAGVPQGSVLAPLLHYVYASDIPTRPGIETPQFADDIATYTSNKYTSYAVSNLQRCISDLEAWLCKWR